MFSGCTVLPGSKETKLGSSEQEAPPSAGKNNGVVLVPCSHMVEPPTKFSKTGGGGRGLTGPQLLEGGCWERQVTFFKGLQFSHTKNKLKSEIFNDKKVYRQKHFSVIIKNSN